MKATNQRNEKTTKERDFPWKVVWGSAVVRTDDLHLEPPLGLRHSMLSDFGTDSIPVNHYLVSYYELHLNKLSRE